MVAVSQANREPNRGWVFCRYFRHWRTGKRVYPKRARFIRFRRRR